MYRFLTLDRRINNDSHITLICLNVEVGTNLETTKMSLVCTCKIAPNYW